jgi:phosphatidylglycerophosphatase A
VLLAIWIAGRAETLLQEHDSHAIVIDEIVGYLAATLFMAPTWENTLIAFVVFRVFDVVKPYPAGAIDRGVRGGAGVVLDDVVSGLYANLATRALTAMLA